MVGRTLSHHKILEELSRGGRGIVYHAVDIETGYEHTYRPILYVGSFYFLGKIHEHRGDETKAREYYRRFCEFWKDGDMDRERVEETGRKIETM